MSRVAAYREQMLARKAAAAGCSVAELLRRGERQLQISYRVVELRCNRRSGWPEIARRALAYGRTWQVIQ